MLVAEALAYGDMGLALPILAPGGWRPAFTHWGGADRRATYLEEFAGETFPQACPSTEPQPLFDPTRLKTTMVRTIDYRLDVKSLIPAARRAVYCRRAAGQPSPLFIVESATLLTAQANPRSVEIRSAALVGRGSAGCRSRNARLGEDEASDNDYSEALALARVVGALARSAPHAVLDCVFRMKPRQAPASRSLIAKRWRSCANIAIEPTACA